MFKAEIEIKRTKNALDDFFNLINKFKEKYKTEIINIAVEECLIGVEYIYTLKGMCTIRMTEKIDHCLIKFEVGIGTFKDYEEKYNYIFHELLQLDKGGGAGDDCTNTNEARE